MAGKNIGQFTPKATRYSDSSWNLGLRWLYSVACICISSSGHHRSKIAKLRFKPLKRMYRIITVSARFRSWIIRMKSNEKHNMWLRLHQCYHHLPDAPGFLNDLAEALQTTTIDYTLKTEWARQTNWIYRIAVQHIVCDGRFHDFGQFLEFDWKNETVYAHQVSRLGWTTRDQVCIGPVVNRDFLLDKNR